MCKTICLAAAVLVAIPMPAICQHKTTAKGLLQMDPVSRRGEREQAILYAGLSSRPFVERYGEYAVAAIVNCSRGMAAKLVSLYTNGSLEKMSHPDWLLTAIASHGDQVAQFALDHCQELANARCLHAFVSDPMIYVMALQALNSGAARQGDITAWLPDFGEHQALTIGLAVLCGFLGLCAFLQLRAKAQASNSDV